MILVVRIILSLLLIAASWRVFHQLVAYEISRIYDTTARLEEAIQWHATEPEAHYKLGLIYRDTPERRDLAKARFYLEKATEHNPYCWWYWAELAQTYELSGMSAKAEQAYLRTVQIDPRSAQYRWRFANLYLRQGKPNKALLQFKKAIELESNSYLRPTLSLLSKAGVAMEQILEIWPQDNKQATLVLLRFLLRQEAVDQALIQSQWDRLLEHSDQPTVAEADFYVRYLLQQGHSREARAEWIRLLKRSGLEDRAFEEGENLIWNGDFGLEFTGRALDWAVGNHTPVTREKAALRFEFPGTENINFNEFQQSVIVDPRGRYRFSFRARSEEISTEQGLYFELTVGQVLLATEPILGTTDWTEYGGQFEAPRDRSLLTVQLRRRPSKRIDNKLKGKLWMEWVRLEPVTKRRNAEE